MTTEQNKTVDLLMNAIKDNQELTNHQPIFMTKTTEELVNSFKAELWSWGLTAKDIDVNSFISTLLSKERNEAYEKGFTTGRQGIIDNVYTSGEEMISEFRRRHPHHMGEAGGYCLMCACIDALDKVRKEAMKLNYWDKEKRNEVIDEVRNEVEKLEIRTPTQVAELNKHLPSTLQTQSYNNAVGYVDAIEDISTLLENLKVK